MPSFYPMWQTDLTLLLFSVTAKCEACSFLIAAKCKFMSTARCNPDASVHQRQCQLILQATCDETFPLSCISSRCSEANGLCVFSSFFHIWCNTSLYFYLNTEGILTWHSYKRISWFRWGGERKCKQASASGRGSSRSERLVGAGKTQSH